MIDMVIMASDAQFIYQQIVASFMRPFLLSSSMLGIQKTITIGLRLWLHDLTT